MCITDIEVRTKDIYVRTVGIYLRTVDIYVLTVDIYVWTLYFCVRICNDLVRKRLYQSKINTIMFSFHLRKQ